MSYLLYLLAKFWLIFAPHQLRHEREREKVHYFHSASLGCAICRSLSIRSHKLPRSHMLEMTLNNLKYLGMFLKFTNPDSSLEYLCKAATRAMFALQRRCQQLHLHDPGIKCKLFDALVKPILCYGCEIWAIVGNRTDLDKLEHHPARLSEEIAWRRRSQICTCLPSLEGRKEIHSSLAAN